jgi:hypothetical protein
MAPIAHSAWTTADSRFWSIVVPILEVDAHSTGRCRT